MKQLFVFIFLFVSFNSLFAQEYLDLRINDVNSDYINESTTMGTKRIIVDSITGIKATEVTVYKERKYMKYQLLDSIFRYDSLLPTNMPSYSISDVWGDYTPDYNYDNSYSDYNNGYDDYNYDNSDDNNNDYNYSDENTQYDEQMQDEYQVYDDDGNLISDTSQVFEEPEVIEQIIPSDSTYVFLEYELESLSKGEIQTNFMTYIPDMIDAFTSIPGHKIHKIMVLDTATIIERDTLTNFTLETVTWPAIRLLPLKLFVEQKLEIFGKNDPNYQIALSKPITYEAIFQDIMRVKSTFDIPSVAWDSLMSFAVDPNEYLADIIWLEYLIPYYSENIQEPYLREMFIRELRQKKTAKISYGNLFLKNLKSCTPLKEIFLKVFTVIKSSSKK